MYKDIEFLAPEDWMPFKIHRHMKVIYSDGCIDGYSNNASAICLTNNCQDALQSTNGTNGEKPEIHTSCTPSTIHPQFGTIRLLVVHEIERSNFFHPVLKLNLSYVNISKAKHIHTS